MKMGDILPMVSRKYPKHISAVFEDKSFTYQETNHRMLCLANSLIELGIKKGDRVAIMQTNSHEYLEAALAIAHVGAIYVPINYRLREEEVEYVIKDSGSTVFFVGERYVSLINSMRDQIPDIKHYICFEGTTSSMLKYEDLLALGTPSIVEVENFNDTDLFKIQYTSGTTGTPKGAMITHKAQIARMTLNWSQLTKNDRHYCAGTMFHISGLSSNIGAWLHGATCYITKQFDALEVAELIDKEKITSLWLVPSMINFLLNVPNIEQYNLRSVKHISYGAAPIPVEMLKKAISKFNCDLTQAYGSSENGAVTYLEPKDHNVDETINVHRLKSVGKGGPLDFVKVVNERGEEIAPGEVGEIVTLGAGNMIGYWNKPEATKETLQNGWIRSGDLATVDEDGYIYLSGRKKDMIIRGGENIYPIEIENVLYKHPKVLEAVVIGVPDDAWGETVKACIAIKTNESLSSEEIIAFCKKYLASYKCPTSVEFMDELPKNQMGKILKKDLKIKFAKR
ncbi:hypothetical protein BTR23_09315 [Alkalihalophilus pseudofirmus]|nr:hypothetical protein BTR23_09315 [Alkalihalophilus pseudofirmus]